MMQSRLAFLALTALAAIPVVAGGPPCDPTPECALRLTRDMAMQMAQRKNPDQEIIYSVELIEWAQDVAPEPEAVVRNRFATLEKQIGKLGTEDRVLAQRWLGSSMAKAGVMPEAARIANAIDADGRNVVWSNIAEEHARRGRWREAFAALKEIRNESPNSAGKSFATRSALRSVARTGRPELIEEAVGTVDGASPALLTIGLAMADLAAGKDDAAIQRALQQSDPNWRLAVLFEISNWYQDEKREADRLRVVRLLVYEFRKLGNQNHADESSRRYFDGLVKSRQYSQALAWAPELPAGDRSMSLTSLFSNLRDPADIAAAAKLLDLVSGNRDDAEDALAWARIASGMVDPEAGIRSAARPAPFARLAAGRLRDFDPQLEARGRSIIAAAVKVMDSSSEKNPPANFFYQQVLAEAQIKFGLLADARKTIDAMKVARERPRLLLALSVAQSRANLVEAARATRAEAMTLLPEPDPAEQRDSRAELFVRVDLLDDAETELRRLMVGDEKPPAFVRVAQPLLAKLLERGEKQRAFRLAVDWSSLHEDPEAIACFYGIVTGKKDTPMNLWPVLKKIDRER